MVSGSRKSLLLKDSWVELNRYSDSYLETKPMSQLAVRLRSSQGAALVTTSPPPIVDLPAGCLMETVQRQ